MMDDKGPQSEHSDTLAAQPRTGTARWAREYFTTCWRGERGLADTFWVAVIVYFAATGPISILINHARGADWPREIQSLMISLAPFLVLTAIVWVTVSIWRSARRNFVLGQRFWPIVASISAAIFATYFVVTFVNGYVTSLVR
jgi:hypothetical protein